MTETMQEILTDDAYENDASIPPNTQKPKWAQKRIDQLTAEKHAAKARIEELETALNNAAKTDDVEQRATALAAQRDFEARCNTVYAKGSETHADFDTYIDVIGQQGGLTPVVVDAIITSPQAVDLIASLGQNPKLVADLHALPPHLQIAALVRLERKIELEATTPATDAPAPIKALAGIATEDTAPQDTDDIKTWVKKRKAQMK